MRQIKTKERMKGESSHETQLCKLQMENRILQIAMADYVINGVYCLNITQNVSCFRLLLWCHFEQIYCRNSIYLVFFFLFFDSWKFTTNYCHVGSLHINSMYTDLYLILSFFAWFYLKLFRRRRLKCLTIVTIYKALTCIVWYLDVRCVLV